MRIRTIGVEDIDACVDVATDVGWTTPRVHWSLLLRYGQGYGAFEDGELGGTIIAFPHDGFIFLGMMLVRPSLRRRGYAKELLEHAVAHAGGRPAALLATDLGAPLYKSLGFIEHGVVATHAGRWNGPAADALRVIDARAVSGAEREHILTADAAAFGRPRTALVDALLSAATRVAITQSAAGASYAIAWHHESETHVGPVVAVDDDTAFALTSALASQAGGECRIRVPHDRFAFRERVIQAGLAPSAEVKFMTRGAVPLPSRAWYAAALPSTG